MSLATSVSPSRHYVAICPKGNFDGHYFRTFYLPEKDPHSGREYENNSSEAVNFFMHSLNFTAMLDFCVSLEDFRNVSQQRQNADGSSMMFDFPKAGEPYVAARVFRGGEAVVQLTSNGGLARDGEGVYDVRVHYRVDGSVTAAVVGPDVGGEVQQYRASSKEPSDLKWTFDIGAAKVVVTLEDSTVVVRHTGEEDQSAEG